MSSKPLNPIQDEDSGKVPTEGHKESLGHLTRPNSTLSTHIHVSDYWLLDSPSCELTPLKPIGKVNPAT
eukprot:scaffold16995_cov127-Isochrysis_galbana.AAC.14